MFMFGMNTGLRIGDILKVKVQEVRGRDILILQEQKTGKIRRAVINAELKALLNEFTACRDPGEYLFKSRQGSNKPISRVRAYQVLTDAARAVGLDEIGTHTLRKTMGYWHYQRNKDIAMLQNLLNHSSPADTLRYIGISDEMAENSMRNFSMFQDEGI